jgi:predicted transposase/invertase (TIGR01784 family)
MLKNEEIREEFNSRNIAQARKKLSVLKMDEKERRSYEKYMMNLVIERDVMGTTHREGRMEGIKEGIREGEKAKALETARKMLADGLELAMIIKYTGLSLAEVENLQ